MQSKIPFARCHIRPCRACLRIGNFDENRQEILIFLFDKGVFPYYFSTDLSEVWFQNNGNIKTKEDGLAPRMLSRVKYPVATKNVLSRCLHPATAHNNHHCLQMFSKIFISIVSCLCHYWSKLKHLMTTRCLTHSWLKISCNVDYKGPSWSFWIRVLQ